MVALVRSARKRPLLLPLLEARSNSPLALGVGRNLVAPGDTLQAEGKLGSSTTSRLGVESQRAPVDVVDGVAGQVVARVGFGVGAGENAGRGDAELDKGGVVRGFTELPVLLVSIFLIVVVFLYLLPLNGLALLA